MRAIIGIVVSIVIVIIAAFASGAVYLIDETQQVVITQFGDPIGNPITKAGMHFKLPLIQRAHYFEKRLLEWDGDPNQIPTRDKKYIWIDTTARWRIVDALKFLQSVSDELGAQARLDDIVNSATRDVITNHLLVETVRDSNRILESVASGEDDLIVTEEAIERIEDGREEIAGMILRIAEKLAPQYGIELVDVRIKRINYVQAVRQKVYERMIAERKRAAERYRSEGQGKKAEIDGQRAKELQLITSEAYRQAEIIRGKADAEAIKIYAQSYSKDPDFYSFFKTLETYEKTIDAKSTIILTTDGEYYQYLKELESVK